MNIREASQASNKIATDKGFWEDYDNILRKMESATDIFDKTDVERVKIAFRSEKIAIISSELGEAIESMRTDKYYAGGHDGIEVLNSLIGNSFRFQSAYGTHVKDTFEDELADSIIRLLDLCYKMNINIDEFIKLKMEFNKNRYDRHGKKF